MLKKLLLISLALLLTLSFVVACDGEDEDPEYLDSDYEYEEVDYDDEDEDYDEEDLYEEDDYDYVTDCEDELDEDLDYDEDIELDGGMPEMDVLGYLVVVDGEGVPGASFEFVGDDAIFPTHVSLMALDSTLGMDVFWNMQTEEVSLMGLNGFATFTVGSADFVVNGETITLDQESVRVGDEIYVPIAFFRDVYGAAGAYFSGGSVFIDTEETDMN